MLKVFRQNPALLIFCILTGFFSAPGQTYLIAIFTPFIQTDFALSRSAIAALNSGATVAAAFLQPVYGYLLDRRSLGFYVTIMTGIFVAGCFLLSYSSQVWVLGLAFFILRAMGQGAFTLCANVTAARQFEGRRSSALSIKSLGSPLSETISPLIVILLIEKFGWRVTMALVGLSILLLYAPISAFLLSKSKLATGHSEGHWHSPYGDRESVLKLLGDLKFHAVLFPTLVIPFVCTGLFFHQGTIAELKSWHMTVIPAAFIGYGLMRVGFGVLIGPVLDRRSAMAAFPYFLLPLVPALIVLLYIDRPLGAYIYMILTGISVGMSGNIVLGMWAEIYGTKRFGRITGSVGFLVIMSTAAAPPFFGALFDRGVSFQVIIMSCVLLVLSAISVGRMGIARFQKAV